MLEVLESCELDASLMKRCNMLRAAGFRVALDDVAKLTPEVEAFLPAVDIVKLEWPALDADTARLMVRDLKRAGKVVVAEKVDERNQCRDAVEWGCDMVQGFYFSRPQIMETRRLVPDLAQLLDLLNLLINEACDHRIIRALSVMPVLVAQLLRLANSPGNANPKRTAIASPHHALAAIGTTRLFQWCSLLLYNHSATEAVCQDPLVALARQRASLMLQVSLLECPDNTSFAQTAYLTGMLSLLHVIYGREQTKFVEELPIEEGMKAALTDRRGRLGELLLSAETLEGRRRSALDERRQEQHGFGRLMTGTLPGGSIRPRKKRCGQTSLPRYPAPSKDTGTGPGRPSAYLPSPQHHGSNADPSTIDIAPPGSRRDRRSSGNRRRHRRMAPCQRRGPCHRAVLASIRNLGRPDRGADSVSALDTVLHLGAASVRGA